MRDNDVTTPDEHKSDRAKLTVRSLVKTYANVHALASVSLDVREGEFLTLLGPSGSGKTTLLMIVAGLQQQTSGDIWIDGKNASNLPPRARDIGVVFQSYALFPHLTVFENVAFPLQMRRLSGDEIKKRVAEVLQVVELSHAADRLPRQLSGGQQQRVALARATVYRPPLVLMDEPLGALDRRLRDQMQHEIKRLHKALGITVMYVTHDQEEAMSMSDRVCLMNAGQIEQLGRPEELYFKPQTKFAANFLGESNFFRGRITALEASQAQVTLSSGEIVGIPRPKNAGHADEIEFMLRPENLSIVQPDKANNAPQGTISDVSFGGNSYKVLVALNSGGTAILRIPSNQSFERRTGHPVALRWQANDAVIFN
ncbi:MAG: ABC transporter ATP-binding protein [Pseudorhodoplanes sp.]